VVRSQAIRPARPWPVRIEYGVEETPWIDAAHQHLGERGAAGRHEIEERTFVGMLCPQRREPRRHGVIRRRAVPGPPGQEIHSELVVAGNHTGVTERVGFWARARRKAELPA